MAQVSLRFPPSPDVVRTARLVAVAAARRGWLTEDRLDELRLAVGEICARAVRRCAAVPVAALGPDPRVTLEIDDDGRALVVRVSDPAPVAPAPEPAPAHGDGPGDADEAVALALVRGLADSVELRPGPGGPGGVVVMTWNRV
jgi:anti-sigma regulatory factor (Ser/Thr protein kinase)